MRGCPRCGATYATGTQFCPTDGSPTAEIPAGGPAADPFLHKMVGNFQLTRRIGAGSMGAVYEGLNPLAGIRVAVKILGGPSAVDPPLVERFFAEARALNHLAHENIVRVVDLGAHPEGFYYCVMELLEGETLAATLRARNIDLDRGLTLLAQAFDGLGAAHAKGIVHRDLKPANLMIVRHPTTGDEMIKMIKIVDFGVAKLQRTQEGTATAAGTIMGTPAYMSPEQAAGRGDEVDPRSDLYAMGVVAYEVFTGRHPFQGRAIGELIVAQITQTPVRAGTLARLPARLDDLIARLMEKQKDLRPEQASTVATELRAIQHDLTGRVVQALKAPPPGMVPAAAVLQNPPPAPPPAERTPTPTPVRIPSRREAPSPVRKSATPLAMRPVPKKRRNLVRAPFLFAFALFAALLGVTRAGVIDVEPLVGTGAALVGVQPPPAWYGNTALPMLDGTLGAFKIAPGVAACRSTFGEVRGRTFSSPPSELRPQLLASLVAFNRLEECLRAQEKGLPDEAAWVPPYLEGVAAYDLARALDRLPGAAKQVARELRDPESNTAPFDAVLFARRATDAFNDARPDAPLEQRGLIDAFQRALDRMRIRAREENSR